ncbi:hypothetical protein PIB30_101008, partial [Stylosanthes scabra]|nr:hypothetical protein [Stylosanthes scabra]
DGNKCMDVVIRVWRAHGRHRAGILKHGLDGFGGCKEGTHEGRVMLRRGHGEERVDRVGVTPKRDCEGMIGLDARLVMVQKSDGL